MTLSRHYFDLLTIFEADWAKSHLRGSDLHENIDSNTARALFRPYGIKRFLELNLFRSFNHFRKFEADRKPRHIYPRTGVLEENVESNITLSLFRTFKEKCFSNLISFDLLTISETLFELPQKAMRQVEINRNAFFCCTFFFFANFFKGTLIKFGSGFYCSRVVVDLNVMRRFFFGKRQEERAKSCGEHVFRDQRVSEGSSSEQTKVSNLWG